jgi:amino acid adenylation domain-containing protein
VIHQVVPADTVVSAFNAVVSILGHTPAIRGHAEQITYAGLGRLVVELARIIVRAAPADGAHVALLLDRSILAVAVLLGAVRAGRPFVTLDTADAEERLASIVDDAGIATIMTNKRHTALAERIARPGTKVVNVQSALVEGGTDDVELPLPAPDDPISLVYTSGSTGRPKGVVQTQRNYAWYAKVYGQQVGLRPGDRMTMLANLSSGAANNQLLGGLLNGATVCLYDVRRRGPNGLPAWIEKEKIDVLHVVPSLFRFIADNAPSGGYSGVRSVELGGEPVYGTDVRRGRAAFGEGPVIVNRYSATECVGVARHVATDKDAERDAVLPAGRPPTGIEVLIVDDDGVALPAGESGQIVLRSPYLSPGYWRRPDLTAAAFSDDAERPGWRQYRTGDTGTLDAAGELKVSGRADSRVKIRGYTIEPAEVETALRGLPDILDAIVSVEASNAGDGNGGGGEPSNPRLVAYVVASRASAFDPAATRRALSDKVPLHMLPAEFRVLAALPRSSTGKVDRRSLALLPVVPLERPRGESTSANPPADEVELRIASLFAQILDVPVANRDDDFFELGGTSMMLAQLHTEARRQLGAELDLAQLVRCASVADVAALVRGSRASRQLIVPLRDEGTAAPLFLVHGWHGQAHVTPGFLDAVPASHPVLSIQARGLVDGRQPHRSVQQMASEYLNAVRGLTPDDQLPILVGICAGGIIALEMASQARTALGVHVPVVLLDPPAPPHSRPAVERTRDLAAFYVGLMSPRFGPARYVSARIARRLRTRAERNAAADSAAATVQSDAAIRVALWNGVALRRHKPATYDGPVQVIASNGRVSGPMWQRDGWPTVLTGPLSLVGVADEHMDSLSPANPRFRRALRSSIESVAAGQNASQEVARIQ